MLIMDTVYDVVLAWSLHIIFHLSDNYEDRGRAAKLPTPALTTNTAGFLFLVQSRDTAAVTISPDTSGSRYFVNIDIR